YFRWLALFLLVVPGWTFNIIGVFTTQHEAPLLALIFLICLWYPVSVIWRRYPAYGRGIVHSVTFMLSIKLLYILHLPILHERMNMFSCKVLEVSDQSCSPR